MTLESQIAQVVACAVREAIERELPAKFAALDAPIDPDRTYSYAQAAEYLNVTESCIRERVKAGELEAIQLRTFGRAEAVRGVEVLGATDWRRLTGLPEAPSGQV